MLRRALNILSGAAILSMWIVVLWLFMYAMAGG